MAHYSAAAHSLRITGKYTPGCIQTSWLFQIIKQLSKSYVVQILSQYFSTCVPRLLCFFASWNLQVCNENPQNFNVVCKFSSKSVFCSLPRFFFSNFKMFRKTVEKHCFRLFRKDFLQRNYFRRRVNRVFAKRALWALIKKYSLQEIDLHLSASCFKNQSMNSNSNHSNRFCIHA